MRKIRKTIFMALLVVVSVGSSVAQFSSSNTNIRDLVGRIQSDTITFRNSAQNAADRGNYRVSELNPLIANLDAATVQLDRRLGARRDTSADASLVIDRATQIDNFLANNRVGAGTQRDWQTLRSDLDQLARAYNLTAQWRSGGYPGSSNGYPGSGNVSGVQLRQTIQQLDSHTTTFSSALRQDLNQRGNDRSSNDRVRQQLTAFEMGVVQIRNRGTRQITSSDVSNLLETANSLNGFVSDKQLSYQTENAWTQLRSDLDALASAFNVATNWSNYPANGNPYPGDNGYGRDLTGTYRIAASQSDDARRAVDDATRNLSLAERQRIYDSLLRRLDPPQMLALDRRGNAVTIASTRAPQISFTADGREQVETTQNGRTIRVRAQLSGNQLSISRSGDRANDFTVTFDSVDGGRRLLVTRSLYSDRIPQPVTVRGYYDRVSDVAQLDLYDTNREYPSGSTSGGATGDVVGSFVVPNGTELVAVLNDNLTTQNARENQRFSMTVRSPSQYDGATIQGYVASINRGGRVTGRSEMTLDFDTIRLRDGRSYRFAGILESVRTSNGEIVNVDNEGAVRDSDQTNKTITRTAIGSGVGAIIGAIAGGGKGAAIGAVVGATAGAGSVYVQGPNDLELYPGTEVTVKATGPRG
ncbi:MAG TPA: YMGG-like glycine zipper-containing protein [Pyrinomonadaceae bacterium]|nr:YMGG-like glycine zipper-containing protein [Pyrinomonadaceae bacterium]